MPVLKLPNPSKDAPTLTEVTFSRTVVIVGANGAGKSRLGAWLENPRTVIGGPGRHDSGSTRVADAFRIGAQRVLNLPASAERLEVTAATTQLQRGSDGAMSGTRLAGDPVVGQSADFPLLVNALFADRMSIAATYLALGHATGGSPGVPQTDKLTELERTWSTAFPHRRLVFGDHTVRAAPSGGGDEYGATLLSDGERVGFYLIGQALLAPKAALIIVDEPEIHLHESLQGALWSAIENARVDCRFVYLTHSLHFAATRTGAPVVILHDYLAPSTAESAGEWKWSLVPEIADIPEEVVLRVLGSRRQTVFVEGTRKGLDHRVYGVLLPERHLVPAGGAPSVMRAVRAFSGLPALHHHAVEGIVDRDDRSADEVAALTPKGVRVLSVACVENVMIAPALLEAVVAAVIADVPSRAQRTAEACSDAVAYATSRILELAAQRAQYRVRQRLDGVVSADASRDALVAAVAKAANDADPGGEYDRALDELSKIGKAASPTDAYRHTLLLVRDKGLLAAVAQRLGLTSEQYVARALALLAGNEKLRRTVITFAGVG